METAAKTERVVVLTGAASGIGRAAAEHLAAKHHRLVLIDRNPEVQKVTQALADRCGSVEAIELDLSDLVKTREVGEDIGRRYGRFDVLINNAGVHPKIDGRRLEVHEVTLDIWRQTQDINLGAPFMLAQAAFPLMRKHGWGRIVNVSSRAGRTFSPEGSAHYGSSKAGLMGLTRVLAGEGGPHGITCNAIAPGRVITPLSTQGIGAALHEKYKNVLPVGRIGVPDDVVAAIAFFMSEESGFTTGTVLDVNGGGFMG